jgi:GntR family transcriptional regulator, transcriptional repressor for pyruvate dehydrogenase complex
VQKRRAAEHVAEQIREQILAGRFPPGRRLPPERELAGSFGVNRTTLREALRTLEQQRLLDIHHGDGATVLDVRFNAGLELLAHLVRVDGKLDLQLLVDILEARRFVGIELARLAALRAEEPDLGRLEDVLEDLSDPGIGVERFQELDWSFFEALAQAARNRVLILILNTVRPIYLENRDLFLPMYEAREPVIALHRRLLERLRYRDPAGAVATIGQFLDLAMPGLLPADRDADEVGASGAKTERHSADSLSSAGVDLEIPVEAHKGVAVSQRSEEPSEQSSQASATPRVPQEPQRGAQQASGPRPSANVRVVAPSAEPWLERNNQ